MVAKRFFLFAFLQQGDGGRFHNCFLMMKVILTGILTATFRGAMILGNRLPRSPLIAKKQDYQRAGFPRRVVQNGAQRGPSGKGDQGRLQTAARA
jgi:hypothetical protein